MKVVWLLLFFSYVQSDKGINQQCITPHGEAAVCMELTSCRHLYDLVKKKSNNISVRKYVQQSFCGKRRNVYLVCCGTPVDVNEECGVVDSETERVFGGVVKEDHFPWMAALQYKEEEKIFKCAGFLINSQFVLTAAHCLKAKQIHSVHLGISNLTDYQQHKQHIEVEIINITYPEAYKKHLDDIGLIRIKPIKYTSNIRWICLPKKNAPLPDWFTIRGWGKNDKMIKTFTNVIENRIMFTVYDECPLAKSKNLSSNCIICAGGEINKDSCEGDSGGALMAKPKNIGWTAFGVVSFGSRDCSRGDPAVYTKIQCFSDWIEKKMLELLAQE